MNLASLLTGIALTGLVTVTDMAWQTTTPLKGSAIAEEMKDTTGLTTQQKVAMLTKNKHQFGSGDQLRRFFFGDLEPVSVQPGGAGMVVNLYNKASDTTFAYCATYDVVIAIKPGKVTQFAAAEVK